MNKVLLTGRLTRDPEMRSLSSGKTVTQFSIATNEYIGQGKEKAEYHNIVTWDRLAQTCGEFLGKGQQVADRGPAPDPELGRRSRRPPLEDGDRRQPRRDAVRTAEEGLRGRVGGECPGEPGGGLRRRRGRGGGRRRRAADGRRVGGGRGSGDRRRLTPREGDTPPGRRRFPSPPPVRYAARADEHEERHRQDDVDEHQQRALEPVRLAVERDERADPDRDADGGHLERLEDEVHRLADERGR